MSELQTTPKDAQPLEPTTPTGKRLLDALTDPSGDVFILAGQARSSILAIEREAAAAERERLYYEHSVNQHGAPPTYHPRSEAANAKCYVCRLLADPEDPDRG